ncbi:MAG TPA: energy transducer TonB [Candidatus Binataceae bacterium]|nr:energy transducer TonB [Candidatus Binataceae bacterium]
MPGALDNYEIDPEWRVVDRGVEPRARGFSAHAIGFSIAAHLMLAGLLLIALLHLGGSRPSQPVYLVAQIVDRIPGADAGANQSALGAEPGKLVRPSPTTRNSSSAPKHAMHRSRSIRSWVEKHIAPTSVEARKIEADGARNNEQKVANAESIAIQPHPAAVIDAASAAAIAKPGGGAGAAANRALGGGSSAGGSGASAEGHAAYGEAPAPEYPAEARRMEQQGLVMLRVLVAADGSTKRVEIARSSGFQLLDSVARDTVRERWRFVPAMRDGAAVEGWVMVPIRFALTEADASD